MDIHNYKKLLNKAYKEIPKDVIQSTRFRIPTTHIRREGRNTYITNFFKIISKLNRDKNHFLGIFLKNVGTFGETRGQQLFLKGYHKRRVLNRIIKEYAEDYVLCDVCNKPDTKIIKEGKKEYLKCTACGARREIK
ncbi:MAG: translation initiation factor IF-2 subunit beta [Promethearchaeia archaeon]